MKIKLRENIKATLPTFIIFNTALLIFAIYLINGYLDLNNTNYSDIGCLILFATFLILYILSIISTYFLNQKYVPLILKIHPILLVFFFILSFTTSTNLAREGILLSWFLIGLPIMIVIFIHSVIILIIGKKGWFV